MHPLLDQERFPVLLHGMPKPVSSNAERIHMALSREE